MFDNFFILFLLSFEAIPRNVSREELITMDHVLLITGVVHDLLKYLTVT